MPGSCNCPSKSAPSESVGSPFASAIISFLGQLLPSFLHVKSFFPFQGGHFLKTDIVYGHKLKRKCKESPVINMFEILPIPCLSLQAFRKWNKVSWSIFSFKTTGSCWQGNFPKHIKDMPTQWCITVFQPLIMSCIEKRPFKVVVHCLHSI